MTYATVLVVRTVMLITRAVVLSLCRIVLIESAQVLTARESVQTADAQ